MTQPHSWILAVLLAVGCEGDTTAPPASAPEEQPEAAPEPEPVYTSVVCCATGRICTLSGALPLGADCSCPNDGDPFAQTTGGHVC